MKILINYLGRNNAGPLIALEMAKGFVNCGYDVSALISTSISNLSDWKSEKDIRLYEIDTYNGKIEFLRNTLEFYLLGNRKLRAIFGTENFDLIINPMHHFWSQKICAYFHTRVVTVCHDPIPHDGENIFETYMTHSLMRASDDLIVMTESFIPVVQKRYHKNRRSVHYMPHGLLNAYTSQEIKSFRYSDKKWHLLFFGRIEDYKGLDTLLKAYGFLKKKRNDIDLVIAGKGNISPYMALINETNPVVINRYISDSEVSDYFDADNVIVVLPYKSASQSGVVAVSLAFKNFIVVSDVGGIREQLGNGMVGVYFEPNNDLDLAYKINELINDEGLQQKQLEKMDILKKSLDWSSNIKKLMDELLSNLDDKGGC